MSKLLLIVLSACSEDYERVVSNLHVVRSFEASVQHPVLITHHDSLPDSARQEILTLCEGFFSSVKALVHPTVKNPWWPVARNRAWQATARHIESTYDPKKFSGWFWWEPDTIPCRRGWADFLHEAHVTSKKPSSGYRCLDSYMHGSGIWPLRITDFCADNGALYTTNYPFDRVAARSTRDMNVLNGNVVSFKKCYGDNLAGLIDQRSIHDWLNTHQQVFLLLECTDGQLQDHILGRTESRPAFTPTKDIYPAVTEQHPEWPTGIFTFPNISNTCFFNPSLAEFDGHLHLFTRRFTYKPEDPYAQHTGCGSDLVIWRIRPNMTLHARPLIPAPPNRYPGEQWEDPRAYTVGNQVFVSFVTWVYNTPPAWTIRQALTRLSPDYRSFEVVCEPDFGGNSSRVDGGSGHEKNWVWFIYDNAWHCSYKPSPHIVFKIDDRGRVARTWKNKDTWTWDYGTPRGGTPPVQFGSEYVSFFHSSQPWKGPKRRYFMGAFTFTADPPFKVLRVTPEPLLVGSEEDFRVMNSPLVVFPAGALLRDNEWLITFGLNDEHCGWVKIPASDLDTRLQPIA